MSVRYLKIAKVFLCLDISPKLKLFQHLSYCSVLVPSAHVTTSLPKSQFMRIRQICSYIKNYDKHATQFIKHFCRRSYSETKLKSICENVWKMPREELLELP